jgi:hypothetical protein
LAKAHDFLSAADRDCRWAADAAAVRPDALALRLRAELRRAVPVGAALVRPDPAEWPDAEAGHAELWARASAPAEVFGFAARLALAPVWLQPAERKAAAALAALPEPALWLELQARRRLARRAREPLALEDARAEPAGAQREPAQEAS